MKPSSPPEDAFELSEFSQQRRTVLKLMAASAAMATGACSGPPNEKIVPFARAPEELLPGRPVFYATALNLSGYGIGVLVEANEGRPTKVEGNPLHPASLGATDLFSQAQILQLWDPARSQTPLFNGEIASWLQFLSAMQPLLGRLDKSRGAGLRLLTGNVCSPTLYSQLSKLRTRFPEAQWHQYDPVHRDIESQGSRLAFGRIVDTRYNFDNARVIVSLGADTLCGAPSSIRYARDFAANRNPDAGSMSRVYALESFPSLMGAKADHRLALPPQQIEAFVYALANAFDLGPKIELAPQVAALHRTLVEDLKENKGAVLILPGNPLSAQAHALVHALNHKLGEQHKTFEHCESIAYEPTIHVESMAALSHAIDAREVHVLVMLGGNPAYDAPADSNFASQLQSLDTTVHVSAYVDETSSRCTWHIPQAHDFESWSDIRAFDGTASIVQPIIAPLYNGRSFHDVLNVLLESPEKTAYETVREQWQSHFKLSEGSLNNAHEAAFGDSQWREALRRGLVQRTQSTPLSLQPKLGSATPPKIYAAVLTANFIVDQAVRDGQFANNTWLQEIPRSASKLTWDNAAYMSPVTAARFNLQTGDEIELRRAEHRVRAGVWVLPDHADDCVTLPLGYGRTHAGPVGNDIGFNAYRVRTQDAQWLGEVSLFRTGRHVQLVTTQHHAKMEGRDIVRSATFAEFARNAHFATATAAQRTPEHSLYPEFPYDGYKWGMAIDLNACIGCNACTIACQAENNIPSVGKHEVQRGREMHWIRIDRYYREAEGVTYTDFQPVPCMHCEHAPCEEVCPVGATVHDSQGLSLQVYNRCVGTRFCSNNCPYKVRRFNFLQYSNEHTESLKAGANPEVTVRERGVMEKCTYCVQRIQRGRIEAEQLGRRIRDGEVITACQAACPTEAIVFGDLNDKTSRVVAAKASPRNYALLAELNTRPRTTYLAQVTNPRAKQQRKDANDE